MHEGVAVRELANDEAARIIEAKREGWLGEVEGLRISLAGVDDRLAQIDRRHAAAVVDLQPLTMCLER